MKSLRPIFAAFALALAGGTALAQDATPGNFERLRQETILDVKSRINPLLSQYCKEACMIVDVKVDVDEQVGESEDIGFEGVSGDDAGKNLFISKIQADIQVDDRVTNVNRDRLLSILKNNLQTMGTTVDIVWKPVTIPQIGQSAAKEEQLKRALQAHVANAIEKVIETYCPEECVLAEVAVDGKLVTPDEATDLQPEELVRDKSGEAILRVEGVDVGVSMDQKLPASDRAKITNVMKAKTRFVSPFNLDVTVTQFPESFAKKKEKEDRRSEDPFGLDKLRQTLKIFREMAGTKEVITTNSSKEALNNSSKDDGGSDENSWKYPAYAAGLMLIAGLIIGVIMKINQANRDARLMMLEAGQSLPTRAGATSDAKPNESQGRGAGMSDVQRKDMSLRMRNEEIREELIKAFLDSPRVAKETFSRLLQEEGVEETARYVHIFGHLVIFELLGDPNLQRDLYELSEYYHKSTFSFEPEEEHRHLQSLRTRVTANEIRVLTRKQMDKFDFLLKLDATQIYNLISEEKAQVQSIVLTQLDHRRRRAVFDMYAGQGKVDLMRELCRADAIPKEYLSNVAKALHKKVTSRPEFDTENLRSSDILLDLLEKAELSEQRGLMQNLVETNPDAARGIKIKLVTVEIMPYLKDGHLLEIIMGMEREDLLTFLAGTREHIRALILSKAPDELANSWIEDLTNVRGFDEQSFRLVEMKVLGRIRALANNGVINLLDINDMIFNKSAETEAEKEQETVGVDSDTSMVA